MLTLVWLSIRNQNVMENIDMVSFVKTSSEKEKVTNYSVLQRESQPIFEYWTVR